MNNGDLKRAAMYTRVSTEEQARFGESLDAQRLALREYIVKNGLVIAGEYSDEGVSGKKAVEKRPAVVKLLEDVRQGKIDIVLFTKLDRWFRNVKEYYKAQDVLDKHGVAWVAINESYETETAAGRLKVNIMLSVAEEEADRTSERIKFVFAAKAAKGEVLSGAQVPGYKIINKHYEVDEETADRVRFIFQQYLVSRSISATVKRYAQEYKHNYNYNSVRRILTNRLYIGEAYGNSNFAPAIIPRADFDLVQELIQSRSQRNSGAGRDYLFSGLVRCADCGGAMKVTTAKEKHVYYICRRHKQYHDCKNTTHTNEKRLETWLLGNLAAELDAYNTQVIAREKKRKKRPDRAAQIAKRMEKLRNLYLNDLIDMADYEREYLILKNEKASLPPDEPAESPVDLSGLDDALCVYKKLSRQAKKAFWTRTLREITVSRDGDFKITPR